MITDAELRHRADRLGIQQGHVERDYVLNHLLAQFSHDPGSFIFRGGTALARVYWPDFRLSEDLDFITSTNGTEIEVVVQKMADRARSSTGLELSVNVGVVRRGRSRSTVGWSTPWDTAGELLIDVVAWEKPALPSEVRQMSLPYSDIDPAARLTVLQLADILGSKWGMLDDRDEPRDLFDLWFAVARARVPFSEVARGHEARYGYGPHPNFLAGARRLEPLWRDRLAHQMSDLPDFAEVLDTLGSVVANYMESPDSDDKPSRHRQCSPE